MQQPSRQPEQIESDYDPEMGMQRFSDALGSVLGSTKTDLDRKVKAWHGRKKRHRGRKTKRTA